MFCGLHVNNRTGLSSSRLHCTRAYRCILSDWWPTLFLLYHSTDPTIYTLFTWTKHFHIIKIPGQKGRNLCKKIVLRSNPKFKVLSPHFVFNCKLPIYLMNGESVHRQLGSSPLKLSPFKSHIKCRTPIYTSDIFLTSFILEMMFVEIWKYIATESLNNCILTDEIVHWKAIIHI